MNDAQTKTLWNKVEDAASAALGKEFYQFTMSAWENAQITVHVEKSAPESEVYKIAISTLEFSLGDTDDTEAQKFFTDLGVTY